ncbi:MAG: hypothetical protein V4611_02965 [Patescibacteria group bacterium]
MSQFEHFEQNEVNFEQFNAAGLSQLYGGATELFQKADTVSAALVDEKFRPVQLSADRTDSAVEIASITTDGDTIIEQRYRLDGLQEAPRVSHFAEGEWFLLDIKDSATSGYIQDAHKIVIRLAYSESKQH